MYYLNGEIAMGNVRQGEGHQLSFKLTCKWQITIIYLELFIKLFNVSNKTKT